MDEKQHECLLHSIMVKYGRVSETTSVDEEQMTKSRVCGQSCGDSPNCNCCLPCDLQFLAHGFRVARNTHVVGFFPCHLP